MPPYLSSGSLVEILDNDFDLWNQARVRRAIRKMKCDIMIGGRVFASTDALRERMPDLYRRIELRLEEKAINGSRKR